jgi:hypothetical protein
MNVRATFKKREGNRHGCVELTFWDAQAAEKHCTILRSFRVSETSFRVEVLKWRVAG